MTPLYHHPKIRPEHIRRQAIVYIRQSSPHQVRDHRDRRQSDRLRGGRPGQCVGNLPLGACSAKQ